MGLPWTCPRGYARPRYRWRYPEGYRWWGGAGGNPGDNEWEEKHMLEEIYRMCHRLVRHEMEEGPKIDEIYYLAHEIARGVAALQEMPVEVAPPIEAIPMQPVIPPMATPIQTPVASPVLAPMPSYPCPSWPPAGLG